MIGKTISHYKILEKLGEGGMGVVYKALDTKLKRTVALKFLTPEALDSEEEKNRFFKEAQATAALDHPNICTIHEIDRKEGKTFIVMGYIEGQVLRDKISLKSLKLDEALDIGIQVAEGLREAHDRGIVHRDIKSGNIMVTSKGQVKIMDFGLAKLSKDKQLDEGKMTMGTAAYMSPEQAKGEEVDHRTDIWSLGVVIYEMFAGQLPFRGEYEQAIVYSILNEEPEPVSSLQPGLPKEFDLIINRALAKSLDSRYQSAGDILVDLRKVRKKFKSVILRDQTFAEKPHPSIAVLPFTNLSADPEQEYFCDGMAEEIINALTHVEGLRVVARTSAFVFRNKKEDIREIGKKLDVETLLEGSVRKAGNKLRISAQLINVADGYHLWSERYDREMEDVFTIQDEISLAIVDRLKVKLLKEEKAKIVKRYTDNVEVYNLYLEGRYYWNKRTPEGLNKAIKNFERVIEMDQGYALAYAGLADCYGMLVQALVLPPKDLFPKAKVAARKALEIDETLAEAHASLAFVNWHYDWDWVNAEREFKRAIELNPNYATAHQWYAMFLSQFGRLAEAISEIKIAQELDPLSSIITLASAWIPFLARQFDQTIKQCRKVLDRDPNFFLAHFLLGMVYEQRDMFVEAIEEYLKVESFFNVLNTEDVELLRETYAIKGWKGYLKMHLDILIQQSKKSYVPPYYIAADNLRLGDKNQAFKWLEKAYQERDKELCDIKMDPTFDSLRSDPRYKALLKKMGLEK